MGGDLPSWRTLSSRVLISDSWLNVRADVCETFDGVRIDPFYVISTADVVAVVAITSESELVLTRQYRHGYGKVALEIPAGRMDPGEDPVAAGLRELAEETGYTARTARLVRSVSPNTLRYTNRWHIVLVEGVQRTAEPVQDPLERIQTTLWPLASVDSLLLHEDFANAALVGTLAAGLAALRQDAPSS